MLKQNQWRLIAVLILFLWGCSRKQVPANHWYEPVEKLVCPGKIFPLKYHTYRVDYKPLRKLLLENTTKGGKHDTLSIVIPYPDGSKQQFSVFPVHVMPDELAQKYPGIATYTGKRIGSPAETIRLDISPAGFRAMVMSLDGTIFVDPYCPGDSIHVISYFKKDMPEGSKAPFEEVIPGDHQR